MNRKRFLILVPLWFAGLLACNLPLQSRTAKDQPGSAVQDFQYSLTAQANTRLDVQNPAEAGATQLPVVPESGQPTESDPAGPTAGPYTFPGLTTATPGTPPPLPVSTEPGSQDGVYHYMVQSGDTLDSLARRFGVSPGQITSEQNISTDGLLPPGQALEIPDQVGPAPYSGALFPDSEIVYSPSAIDFDTQSYIQQAGGYLSGYHDMVNGELLSGAEIVQRLATETSTDPRILLAFLEYRSHWVLGQPSDPSKVDYPIGFYQEGYTGLYKELSLTAKELGIGYYGWRYGTLTDLKFQDHQAMRISPQLNAGSVAVQYLFSLFYKTDAWLGALYSPGDFIRLYQQMFGDPWERAARVEPLFPAGLATPDLELPFAEGERWSFTGGPHAAWLTGSPRGAIDFAPTIGEPPCSVSAAWVTASAPGVVVRAANNVVAIDLDGDGHEQTGWVLIYMHIAKEDQIQLRTRLNTNDRIGHPSCQGGNATGTNVHIARKYNGEWIGADGPLPFVLSGWLVVPGDYPYLGQLHKDGQIVTAEPDGSHPSVIIR